ncbi:MAG: ATP-grasp domain-containing protein [Candidatus Pacebacteria bacterium]|nr:ATP-grasp domain-containing protein [Candidatus Paceibacterota bacterium]
MSKLRVGVLRGGQSSDYDMSLKTGGRVLQHLSKEKYTTHDIYISRNGVWHMRGFEVSPERALKQVDVVFNALHGEYGEDGVVQKLLDTFGVPYTGSGALPSALAMSKLRAKEIVSRLGVRTPMTRLVEHNSDLRSCALEIFRTFPFPLLIKPVRGGSSRGIVFVGSFYELEQALEYTFESLGEIMIEEYVRGKEVTSGVIKNFRGEDHYTLLPIEIELEGERPYLDTEAKHSGLYRAHCPGGLSAEEKLRVREATRLVHDALGLGQYSRSDFICTPRGIYFLEANTQPDLREESLVNRALSEVGCSFSEFVEHTINLAVEGK